MNIFIPHCITSTCIHEVNITGGKNTVKIHIVKWWGQTILLCYKLNLLNPIVQDIYFKKVQGISHFTVCMNSL